MGGSVPRICINIQFELTSDQTVAEGAATEFATHRFISTA